MFIFKNFLENLKEGDVAYLDRIEPTNEKIYGDKANYRISSVREQNRKLAVYFEKIEWYKGANKLMK